ncbi:transcription factor IIIB 90 kDa subunit [Atheta coriaria]|uniref:transcription factor IIIB 90 kDa subunit n=1 Tax=Dalotia coriaria TaxID=877792 RepID=UPI0031F36FA1
MASGRKCKNCGSSDIEVDPARGDAVCTNCGSVLEDNIIVAEVQFEENAHGNSSAIGQFVSADSKGGATKFGASFHVGFGTESREVTLRKAKAGITNLCSQLRLNQHCIDTACNFFKMALSQNLTRGRKNTHVFAACVYLTCRTEGTAHMLIDISDVLQICCYELGRTYLKLSQALCLNIPSLDPCLYILRFAAKLEFGTKTQEVANTALRLVQRMKRDSLHSGRRPSGLCGAALLMASRLHEFSRSSSDIVKIVKVHESTLRKRLIEFGDTPSSALTLEEFMTVDLEEEQDPPSFKAARKKDKERLQRLMEEEADSITELQKDIEKQLEKDGKIKGRSRKKCKDDSERDKEAEDTDHFINDATIGAIQECIHNEGATGVEDKPAGNRELGPDVASMGLVNSLEDVVNTANALPEEVDLSFDDIDDAELDSYIMNEDEIKYKDGLWHKVNAAYLAEMKIKQERLAKEKEEGKPEKKKRRVTRKKQINATSSSAGEAIEKMLQEKKISTKINYDVLKTLKVNQSASDNISEPPSPVGSYSLKRRRSSSVSSQPDMSLLPPSSPSKRTAKVNVTPKIKRSTKTVGMPLAEPDEPAPREEETPAKKDESMVSEDDYDYDEDAEEPAAEELGVMQLLQQHREDEDEDYYGGGGGYDEDEY